MRRILYILFAVGGVLVALALTMVFLNDDAEQVEPQTQQIKLAIPDKNQAVAPNNAVPDGNYETSSKSNKVAVEPGSKGLTPLTIDIARVKADGAAVFAGTAAPDATIRIFEGKVLLGKTTSDSAGEWVVILEKSLGVGQHLISIAMERKDGSTEFADQSLAVEIYKDSETKPLVALLPETATAVPVLIQSPDDDTSTTPQTSGTVEDSDTKDQREKTSTGSDLVMIDQSKSAGKKRALNDSVKIAPTSIIWRDAARILISGTSEGGMRVVVNDTIGPFGEALVLADGTWQIAGSLNLKKARHRLQFQLMNDMNKIIANYTLPLTSRDLVKGKDGSPLVVVNKGDALWRIAYRRLGDGVRYVDIVRQNQNEIVDPNLIYPKQIFVVPKSPLDAANKN